MSCIEQKQLLRKQVESLRRGLTESERLEKSRRICQRLIAELQACQTNRQNDEANRQSETPVLLTFMPIGTEVDVAPVTAWCWQQGWDVIAPRVDKENGGLELHRIRSFDDLQPGVWSIREPKISTPAVEDYTAITVVLVPGLAFDRSMGRLGYGGGYYDRLLRKLEATDANTKRPLLLAPAFDVQIVPQVPVEDHDIRVDRIVTEKRILHAEF